MSKAYMLKIYRNYNNGIAITCGSYYDYTIDGDFIVRRPKGGGEWKLAERLPKSIIKERRGFI